MSAGPWPWGIGIGLGIVVMANAWMIHTAVSHPSAPASADHYAESTRWNEIQAERSRAQALGWRVEVEPCPMLGDEGCVVQLSVRDDTGEPVQGLRGRVRAQRADDVALDREAPVEGMDEAGHYEVALALSRPGLYSVSIRLEGGEAPWVDERRIEVRGTP